MTDRPGWLVLRAVVIATALGCMHGVALAGAAAGEVQVVAGTATIAGHVSAGDGGPALDALIVLPAGVAVDGHQNVYVAEPLSNRVRRIDAITGVITTVAGNGADRAPSGRVDGVSMGDGGPAIDAALGFPSSVAVSDDGDLFVLEQVRGRVRRVDPGGTITTFAGTGIPGFSGDGGPAVHAQLDIATALALAPDGSLYISDRGNQRVRLVDSGGTMTTVAGNGSVGFAGDGGPATQASVNGPEGVAVGPDGTLYIADRMNDRIRAVDPAGTISTFAGTGVGGFSGDGGPADDAQINGPIGLAAASSGALYIVDGDNLRIRSVAVDTTISTYGGTGRPGLAQDGWLATDSSFDMWGLAADRRGDLYISERGAGRIIRIVAADVSPPSIACAQADDQWHAGNVTIVCAASDDGSGLTQQADAHFGLTTSVIAGVEDVDAATGTREVCDNAGNCAMAGPIAGNRIDRAGPTVALACPESAVLLHSNTLVTYVASDGGSGLTTPATGTLAVDVAGVGTKPISTVAIDNVANATAAACSVDVVYDWAGFFSPVDNLPTVNLAQAGSAIPIKFELGGDHGLAVLASGYPRSQTTTCAEAALTDGIEETVSANGSGLMFANGRYTYVWKTDRAWSGTCRQLVVRLIDGTSHRADFRFR